MRKKHVLLCAALCCAIGAAAWGICSRSSDLTTLSRMPARHSSRPYDGEKRIAEALRIARQNGKHVLMQSSAEGCTWCHVLHKLLTTNQELMAKIEQDFIYVLVDTTNDRDRNFYKKYAKGTDHTLVLVVLRGDGTELSQSVGFDIVQEDPHNSGKYHIAPEHILTFLNDWSPRRL